MRDRIALAFTMEPSQVSPDGQRYARNDGLVDSSCRLCNHESAKEINGIILKRMAELAGRTGEEYKNPMARQPLSREQIRRFNVSAEDTDRHVIRHLAPMCDQIMRVMFPKSGDSLFPKLERVDGKVMLPDGTELSESGTREMIPMRGPQDIVSRIDDYREEEYDDDRMLDDGEIDGDDCDVPMVLPVRREPKRREWKEYDTGENHIHPLRRWTEERMAREIEKKTREAVTFLDEMMTVRDMAYKVYEDIMEQGDLKYYNTAVSAIHEVRGVMESLAKLSLIAQKLGDGDEKHARKLSPAMKDMIRAMGITEDTPDELIPARMIKGKYDDGDRVLPEEEECIDPPSTESDASTIPDALLEEDPTTLSVMEQIF